MIASKAWEALAAHFKDIHQQQMSTWFEEDAARFKKFSLATNHILLDYAKNRITAKTVEFLTALACSVNLDQNIQNLFKAGHVNTSEAKPALHTALRAPAQVP